MLGMTTTAPAMPDKPWKAFERECARLIGGTRYAANSGALIDCESSTVVAQCKLVKTLSLSALSDLAETAERQGAVKWKAGVVAVKVRRGHGRRSPVLVVMTETVWRQLHGEPEPEPPEPTPTV